MVIGFTVLWRGLSFVLSLKKKCILIDIMVLMKKENCIKGLFLALSLLLGVSSCFKPEQAEGEVYTDFPITVHLKADALPLDTALFRYPYRIRVNQNRAVVMDLHGTDYYFHLFTYPEFNYLSSFGKRGEGPDEVLMAENIRWDGNFLMMLDSGKSEISKWKYTSLFDSLECIDKVKLDKSVLSALDFALYNDSTYVIPDYSGENYFCWVDSDGHLKTKTGVIPTVYTDVLRNSPTPLAQAWRSFIDYNSQSGILVAATQLGEVFSIYDMRNNTHQTKVGPNGEPVFDIAYGKYGIPTGIMGFGDLVVGEDAIYLLFSGRSFKDIERSLSSGVHYPDGGNLIYVFTKEGIPLRKYMLDRYISGIYVDEGKQTIFATDVNSDEQIVKFKI